MLSWMQVVQYIKVLPGRFSNLPKPKSSLAEQVVMKVVNHLCCQQGLKKQQLVGAEGFDKILTATLKAIAGEGSILAVTGMPEKLQQARLVGEWKVVAQHVLRLRASGQGWPTVQHTAAE